MPHESVANGLMSTALETATPFPAPLRLCNAAESTATACLGVGPFLCTNALAAGAVASDTAADMAEIATTLPSHVTAIGHP